VFPVRLVEAARDVDDGVDGIVVDRFKARERGS
jgi:hypothetical protein